MPDTSLFAKTVKTSRCFRQKTIEQACGIPYNGTDIRKLAFNSMPGEKLKPQNIPGQPARQIFSEHRCLTTAPTLKTRKPAYRTGLTPDLLTPQSRSGRWKRWPAT